MTNKHIYRMKTGEEIRWHGNHHGFVLVYAGRNQYGQRVYEIRKPTPTQRRCMILTYIKENDGFPVKIGWLAKKLGVTDRTIQSDLRFWEGKGFISSSPHYGDDGRQSGNIYHYDIKATVGVGAMNSIKALYQMSNPIGYRTWSWEEFKIESYMEGFQIAEMYEELGELKHEQKMRYYHTMKKRFAKKARESKKKKELEM